jgi:hypothetical protein
VRWLRESKPQGRCLSLEHRYRSPQWGHWDSTPPPIQGAIDLLDAYLIEDAMKGLHWRQKLIFKLAYVKRWQEGWICTKLQINRKDYQETHYFCLIALDSVLKSERAKRSITRNNSETEPSMLLAA